MNNIYLNTMKNIDNFINEKLKLDKNIKIESEISTFKELMEKYGDSNKNNKTLNKFKDNFILDHKYYDFLNKLYNRRMIDWDKFYHKFMDNQSIYNEYENQFEVHLWIKDNYFIQIECRIWENWNTKKLTSINIIKDGKTNDFILNYELTEKYINSEESLVKAFEYMMNMKL